jgi:serine/threonine protein kinase
MPNGGIDVEKFIDDYFAYNSTSSTVIRLNNSLIDLLVNGIVPMNNLNVYHCDIKDANVLVDPTEKGLHCRLIDWGLSIIHTSEKGIPRKLYRRPFQYNVPFSSVLFNKEFLKTYYNFLELYPSPDYFQIREFVVNYIFLWNEIRGPGHLSAINDIVKKLTVKELFSVKKKKIKDHLVEYDFTYYYIVEYLSKILEKYTNNGNLELMTYFNTIFLKNIDIWGFVMIYISLYEYLYSSFEKLNEYQIQFISKIKYIIIHFLYESPINEINVSSLVDELTKLNLLIENFGLDHSSKKLEYLTTVENGGKISKKRKITKKCNLSKICKTRKMRS